MSQDKNDDSNGVQKKPNLFRPPAKGPFRISLMIIVAGFAIVLLINNFVIPSAETEVEYSSFKALVSDGTIRKVAIGESAILGYMNSEAALTGEPQTVYKTFVIDDPGFIELLDEKGIEYFAVPVKSRPLLSMLISWILPLAVILLVWRFIMSRMGGSGNRVLAFGKNKAQIVAEGDTETELGDAMGVPSGGEESWPTGCSSI